MKERRIRMITNDHILFDECIEIFRPSPKASPRPYPGGSYNPKIAFLLPSFNITQEWDLGICSIQPSKVINLPGGNGAFINTTKTPSGVTAYENHLFGTALSCILSTVCQLPVKSPKDVTLHIPIPIPDFYLYDLILRNPIQHTGPMSSSTRMSQKRQQNFAAEAKALIELLLIVDYKSYLIAMRAIRQVYLSIINFKEDYGLGYLMAVSAIETVAQAALSRDKVKPKEEKESTWKKRQNQTQTLKNY